MNNTRQLLCLHSACRSCYLRYHPLFFCTTSESRASGKQKRPPIKKRLVSSDERQSHKTNIRNFFKRNPQLEEIQKHIPEKYLALKRVTPPENLYLIDENIAKKAASHVLPDILKNREQVVCETNAGLGLISSELLDKGVDIVRLYESCPEFKAYLKDKFQPYSGRVELFTKDIFLLHRYEYIDKQDNGNRVERFFKGVARTTWEDDPIMTIIGALPNMNFIRYLIKSMIFQSYITSLGRIQFYTFMRPRDYIVLTAGPHLNLHTYQRTSVIFNLFFDCELLEKFPRNMFLPWQSPKSLQMGRYPGQIDSDSMYFVRMNFKRQLPVAIDNLLPFYSFVQQFFGKGTTRIVPILEKWVPGSGVNIMFPKRQHRSYFENLNIFTEFGELTPLQILAVFEEMMSYPDFDKRHFLSIIESHLIKTETVEGNLDEHLAEKSKDSSKIDSSL